MRRTVKFGSINGEPIEWIELEHKNNKSLLLAKQALLSKKYHDGRENVTWENCALREYLNSGFIDEAFDEEEKKQIQETLVVNSVHEGYDTDGGNDTKDKVFLLSLDEVYKYFQKTSEAKCFCSQAAVDNGWLDDFIDFYSDNEEQEFDLYKDYCWWRLRTPGANMHCTACIKNSGMIQSKGVDVDNFLVTVRPALWTDVSVDTARA